jgi:SMODS and SLOG-associating 2TM effector domain
MESQSAASPNHASSGNPLAGISALAGDGAPHPKWEWATTRIRQRRELCDQRALAHDARAVFWQRWAAPLTWLTAVLAALTGLSVVAGMTLTATVLSILTAVVAATVAAFQPAEAAKSHRAAATAYERLARKLDDVEALDLGEGKQQIPPDKIDSVRTEISKLEEELNAIELSHPPVSSFNHQAEARPMELGHSPIANFKHHIATR